MNLTGRAIRWLLMRPGRPVKVKEQHGTLLEVCQARLLTTLSRWLTRVGAKWMGLQGNEDVVAEMWIKCHEGLHTFAV